MRPTPHIQTARHHMYESLILDTAENLFADRGVDHCQVKDVAKSAGISLSTQYKYFRSKAKLLSAVHARRLTVLMERISKAVGKDNDPLKDMLSANEVYLMFHMDFPNYLGMHLREGNAWFKTDKLRCPEQRKAFESGIKRASSTFKRGIRKGVFVNDPPLLMAQAAIAANQVHLSHWVSSGHKESPQTIITRAHKHFIRAFCCPSLVTEFLKNIPIGGRK